MVEKRELSEKEKRLKEALRKNLKRRGAAKRKNRPPRNPRTTDTE